MKYPTVSNRKNAYAWVPALLWILVILCLTILPVVVIFAAIRLLPSGSREIYHMIKDIIGIFRMFGIKVQMDKVAHFGMYFVLGVLLILGCWFSSFGLSLKGLSLTGFIGVGCGISTEFLQRISATRSFSVGDMYANLIGLVCGFVIGCILVVLIKIIKLPFTCLRAIPQILSPH